MAPVCNRRHFCICRQENPGSRDNDGWRRESHGVQGLGWPGESGAGGSGAAGPGPEGRAHQGACRRPEFPRHPDDRRQIPVQAGLPLCARHGMRRRDRGRGREGRRPESRRPRHGHHRQRRLWHGSELPGQQRVQDSRQHALRGRGRFPDHLWHHLARAGRSRPAEEGRGAAGTWRGRRRRAECGGTRPRAGRHRDRHRGLGREGGDREGIRRHPCDQLFQGKHQGPRQGADRRQRRRRDL